MRKAIIITGKLVQDHEYIYPYYRLQEAGYQVDVAIKNKEMVFGQLGAKIIPTLDIVGLNPNEFDIVVIPGGAKCLEYLRQDQNALDFIANAQKNGKVISAICHGTQMLISAKIVKGKKISGYYSIKDDINNAGATYIDAPAVIDGNIVTSPHYKYLGDWMRETLKLAEKK